MLYPNATKGLANCQSATGIDIFAVSQFPSSDQVKKLSQNVDCANYLNQINQRANAEIQCNVTVEGVPINFGHLIAEFLTGKTGNETDTSKDDTIQLPSGSDSGTNSSMEQTEAPTSSKPDETPKKSSPSTSASDTRALSFIAYCVAATLALALQ
ncbi:hypothetical protein PsorP6_003447 [Peronosclerospora sorghi]|uniref:Uncharacterized protein n=1 Tax=Peronosclerospora sorghi TaxID=230839 RepID=A0ACC0VJL0_9STRA|nr:hypothetical protein PsorP6_003447 [Peronosclerospora sorghi]